MKKLTFIFAIFCLILGIIYGVFFAEKRGFPFVTKREQWTIGIIRGDTPFSFHHLLNWFNPIFKAEHVTDMPAKFVADPFLIKEKDTWYLFFEAYNLNTKQGDLAVATSTNTWKWNYQQVILDEPFHLSYPYVFKWENEYFLIPESFEANSIRLYKADDFPTQWSYIKTLVEGKNFVDNSIVHFQDKWWLFTSTEVGDTLYLYFSDSLLGPWEEHPRSPIVEGNNTISRPAGRLIEYEGSLYRFAQDVSVGLHQVFAFRITDISPNTYTEEMVGNEPILSSNGNGWKKQAMHQIDPVQVGADSWIASVDGFGEYPIFGWNY